MTMPTVLPARAQALDDGEPILARHVDVEDQDVGRLGSQQRVELGAGAGAAHREAVRGQIVLQQQPEIGLVVDDDDAGGAGHAAARSRRTSTAQGGDVERLLEHGQLGARGSPR